MKIALLCLRIFASFRTEVKVVIISLVAILLLPVFAVIVIAESGLSIVSDALAIFNPVTHMVEVRDPDGKVVVQLQATTTWPSRGYVSLEFGEESPYQKHHTGIDIANPLGLTGDPVTAFIAGKVTKADPSEESGYGKHVIVDHGNNITSLYGHLSAVNVIEKQDVKPGDVIGLEGDTGHATGPHVHFEVRVYGIPVNPRVFMVGEPVL
jgi:murein DD-endopeptidase MepM/ murein hydrolase activator NlpD